MQNGDKRVTIYDIANSIGLSHTTVYRALNNKGCISPKTHKLILKQADLMGYKTNLAASSMSRKSMKIGIVIDHYYPGFHDEIIKSMKEAFSYLYDFKVEGVFADLDATYDKAAQLKKLRTLANSVNAIIFSPYKSNDDYIEFIDSCYEKKIPVFTFIHDIPSSKRTGTVRVNSHMVGNMGAELLCILNGGANSALYVGNKDIVSNKELVDGFLERMSMEGNSPLDVLETQNEEERSYRLTDKLLKEHPEIDGLFVGIAQSLGVCKRISEAGLTGKVKIICVDIYKETVDMLKNGIIQAIIYQQTKEIGYAVVQRVFDYLTTNKLDVEVFYSKPQIIIKSNYFNYL